MKLMILCLGICLNFTVSGQQHLVVHFDFNKYFLTTGARASLDSFIHTRQNRVANLNINLSGHCDGVGSDPYNDRLSQQRVETVKNYLVEEGVSVQAITEVKAFGKRNPLNENSNETDRALNRRVEIEFSDTAISNINATLKEKIADPSTVAGSNIVLRNIHFYGGMHQFLPESTPQLQELLDAMLSYPRLQIRIEGHICCWQGPEDGLDTETGKYNLSEARSKAIREYLISNGVAQYRVGYRGFGHSAPIYAYPEKTEEERTENRRVEIKIISK